MVDHELLAAFDIFHLPLFRLIEEDVDLAIPARMTLQVHPGFRFSQMHSRLSLLLCHLRLL